MLDEARTEEMEQYRIEMETEKEKEIPNCPEDIKDKLNKIRKKHEGSDDEVVKLKKKLAQAEARFQAQN
ncbi:MAG: hypothetical protein ISS41_07360 [Candidatus Aminicenantes bacterium]|nr:hypothetical protein [Candidatus Aminicenantes bacterium]